MGESTLHLVLRLRGGMPGTSKKEKDPNAPKRPLSGYFLFMADERANVKKANPDWGVADIAKELGGRWSNMDEAQKKKYQEKAAKDKERYEAEMKKYTNNSRLDEVHDRSVCTS